MPLAPPVQRKPLHSRQISCVGYLRDDGLYDIDARLFDSKSYDFPNQDRGGTIKSGEALHDLSLRVTLDSQLVIHQASSISDETPYTYCKQAGKNIPQLVGLQIGPGWMREVLKRIGGTSGCTHLTEMLKTIATTAFQTLSVERAKNPASAAGPKYLNTCMSYASDSPVVLRQWPAHYTGNESS
jgi:hypothetical protein